MTVNTSDDREIPSRRKGNLWQLVLVLGVLALIWFSFGQNVLLPQAQGNIPSRFGELKLIEGSEGPEAAVAISRLHGSEVDLVSAYIATYAGGDESLTVWVGQAASNSDAAALMSRMVEAIGPGASGFSNLNKLTVTQGYHEHQVYQVDGPGGKHFFYISRLSPDRVVWLTIQSQEADTLLETGINNF